jgi:hypothetical protein
LEAARQYLSIYSLRRRDGNIVFGPESIPEHHRHAAPPGTVYTNPPPGLKELFAGGQPLIVGPCPDEYGTFVSAFVPLRDSDGRRTPIVLGMDIMANDWRRAILVASAESVSLTFVVMVLLLLSLFSVRATRPTSSPTTARWTKACISSRNHFR